MPDTDLPFRELPCGFEYGAAKVQRCMSDARLGWVVITITTPKGLLDVRITRTGNIRVISDGVEWTPPKKK